MLTQPEESRSNPAAPDSTDYTVDSSPGFTPNWASDATRGGRAVLTRVLKESATVHSSSLRPSCNPCATLATTARPRRFASTSTTRSGPMRLRSASFSAKSAEQARRCPTGADQSRGDLLGDSRSHRRALRSAHPGMVVTVSQDAEERPTGLQRPQHFDTSQPSRMRACKIRFADTAARMPWDGA
jgi:hypothetical protein